MRVTRQSEPRPKGEAALRSQTGPSASKKPRDLKGPKPVIKAENETHDFGTVWVGPTLNHSFKITNEGDVTLQIQKVKPSCGCTIAGQYPRKLEPGETGEFPFALKSAKLRGRFQKSITITSNDPVTERMRLTLKGEVKRYVDVSPASASFGRITDQEPRVRELTITNNTDTPLKLTLNKRADDKFDYELIEKEPGKRYGLRVTANPPFTPGSLRSTLKLGTNIEEQKAVDIRAVATVPPRLEVQPSSVIVRKARSGSKKPASEGIARVLRFTNYGKTKVRVLDAKVADPTIGVSVRERKEGQAYTIEIKLPAGYIPPLEGRMITITTDDPEQPEILVPIRGTARPRPSRTVDGKRATKPDSLIGKPAPKFALRTIDDKTLSSATIKDTVTVLNFFAPNCGYCRKQIPRLETVRAKYADKGVRFVNVSQNMRKPYTQEQVVEKVKELGFHGELAINHDNSVGKLFGATGFPTMIVLGKTGKVEAKNVGNVADLESRLSGQLDALLAGKPVPAVAKAPAQPLKVDVPRTKRVQANDLIGKPAPKFALKTLEGKDLSNAALTSAPATVLNFFAGNCGFCKKQIPRLEKIRKEYEGKGIRFVNVAESMRKEYSQEEIVKLLKDLGWSDEIAHDPKNSLGPKFGATGFPTMIVLGKSGKVEAVNRGNIGDLETRLKSQLDALLAGKPVPVVAKAAAKSTAPKTPSKPRPARVDPASLVGKPAPKFALKTLEGKDVSNATLASASATILNFFACNCGYCGKQIPRLEKVRKEYEGKGVRFINVAESMRKEFSQEEVVAKMKAFGWNDEVALDPKNEVGPPFGATGFPTMIVLGKSGKVEAVTRGNVGDLETRVKGQLDALLAGKPIPVALAKPPARKKRASARDLVGRPAPAINLTTVDGKTASNSEFANAKATVLNFFACNCGYCGKQIPRLETVRKEYESKGVRFVNVAQTMRKEFSKEETMTKMKAFGWGGEVVYEPKNTTGRKFNATGFPTMIVIGKNGKIQAANIGNIGDLETKLKSQLDTLIAGKDIAKAPAAGAKAAAKPRRRPAEDLVGKPAPEFALTTFDGKAVASADFASHPATVLNFIAPNCGFCKRQVPNVEKVRAEYEAKGIRFVNVAMTMRKEYSEAEITDVFKGVGSKIELAKDAGNKVGKEYKAVSFPTMIVVGKDGKIAHVNIGAKPNIETLLKSQLDGLIKGG